MQISLFDLMYEKYKIKKPIRLIELFAGYGSQALALKYLGVEFTHWRICEWAVKSIQAYKDIHFSEDNNDYSQLATKEQIIKYLAKKGISANYNEPMTYEQIKRLNEKQLRTIYNNIFATKNLVNISQVKAKDLDICDTKNYDYIMTYSFPCQDLSLCGLRKGMGKNSGTRSGLLWEVERILDECSDIGNMPQILIMENVPEVIGKNNIKDFQKWIEKLESLGYSNYVECLNSKDYGVPQNRNRCFMISILGEYSYKFPLTFKLELRLKDLLESNVDEKYYLSDKMVNYITADNDKWTGNNNKKLINKKVASTLNTNEGSRRCDASNYICEELPEEYDLKNKTLKETLETNDLKEFNIIDSYNRKIKEDGICITLTTRTNASNNTFICVPETTKKGYAEAHNGDGVYINRPHQKGIAPTVMENHGTGSAVLEENNKNLKQKLCNSLIENGLVEEGDIVKHSYTQQILDGNKKCVEKSDGIMITLTTRGDCNGVVVKDNEKKFKSCANCINFYYDTFCGFNHPMCKIFGSLYNKENVAGNCGNYEFKKEFNYNCNLRIRKLTPKECFRLMGVKDEDYEKVAKNQSNASLYHLAGDSIVTTCLMAIFKNLL